MADTTNLPSQDEALITDDNNINQVTDPENNNVSEKTNPIRAFLTENLKTITSGFLSGIFSVAAITYVITNLLITNYITAIGFGSLKNASVTTDSTTHSIIFNSAILLGVCLYIFCLAPVPLRILYSEGKNKYFKFEEHKSDNFKLIKIPLLFVCFATFPIVAFILAICNKDINLSFLTPFFLTAILYLLIYWKGDRKIFLAKSWYYMLITLFFCFLCTSTFFPFYFLLSQIDYSFPLNTLPKLKEIPGDIQALFGLWLVYTLLFGLRIHLNSILQYILDILFVLLLVGLLIIFSPKTFILPLVEHTGIKDDHAYIYKVSKENFDKYLLDDIPEYWGINFTKPNTFCAKSPKFKDCPLLFVNQKKDGVITSIYFSSVVIYRDEKREVLCPPTIDMHTMLKKFVRDEDRMSIQSNCFAIPTGIIEPTPLTKETLLLHKSSLES